MRVTERVAGLVLLGVVAAGALLATGAEASSPASCGKAAPSTAEGYQAMFDDKGDATWSGGDQAASVALPDGRVVWLFADTLRGGTKPDGSRAAGTRMVHNSLLVQDGGCLTAVPAPAEVVPSPRRGEWYWPQAAVVQGDALVVFCSRVRGSSATDFRSVGVDVALFDLRSGTPRLVRALPTAWSQAPETTTQYGKAFAEQGGWLYSWGSRKVPGEFGKAVAVARVRPADLLQQGAWRYWDGTGWSPAQADAVDVVQAGHGWSTSFSVLRRGGLWTAVAKSEDVYGSDVVAATGVAPTGPFVERVVGQAPSSGDLLQYTALAHPELPLANGGLLVSVCRNSLSERALWADADLYKPQFSAVTP